MTSAPTSHGAGQAGNAAEAAKASPPAQRTSATRVAVMRGHAWALADLLEPGCGGVVEVPTGTSEEDVQALEKLGAEVRRSCWVRIPTWTAGGAA